MKLGGHALFALLATIACVCEVVAAPADHGYEVGFAKVDLTPDFPIRLAGFAARKVESDGVRQHIFARAMAIRHGDGEPVVLVTVDSIGIPIAIRDEVAHRLAAKRKLPNERFAVSATHSHSTPMLAGVLPTMFGMPVPPDQQERIAKYSQMLTDRLEQASLAALDDLKPGKIAFGIGKAGFSINRRTRGGPVDHDLPVMIISGEDGKVRGVYVNYACHCVVLSDNKLSGDWAGCASEELEHKYPNSVALVSIGCGADSNPECGVTGDKGEFAQQYGREIAAEVERLQGSDLKELNGDIACRLDTIPLDLQPVPSRDEWTKRASAPGAEGYYARVQLERLDRGEKLPTQVAYPVQTWKFGNSLAMVFLSGEVVVDYALRLKNEFDASRLWLNAYSNDMPAYIPSERVLKEGGYEGGGAMIYYSQPAYFAPGLEDKIIAAAGHQLGNAFKKTSEKKAAKVGPGVGTQGVLPKSPQESLATIQVPGDLRVELVASEPLVESPVAIDFGPDGKLWVAEMRDYGCKDGETCPPNGRVRVLEDRDRDGKFETATVFLDKIAEPMGITLWRDGVLISAAPDLIYARDTDGDGKADDVKKLFTGFSIENPQARLNMLAYGLDGWLEAGCMFAGKVRNLDGVEIDVGNHDFRLQPDSMKIEPENGHTENTRVRDDWGNWFGTENGVLCIHYPLADRYVRRNPHLLPPPLAVFVAANTPAARLYPRGEIVLLPLSGPRGQATAACGITFYRDELLGPTFVGNAFTCEPVSQLVHRMVLRPNGATFKAERPADETKSEFLTSTDKWFRPVQARTGPDGALWIVDMHRYVIEHSRWIPKETQDELDVYAGNNLGRIYRVLPKNAKHQPLPQINKLNTPELAAALDSPNGTLRDMVQQQIVWRGDLSAVEPLSHVAADSSRPAARLQALWTLELLGKLTDAQIKRALSDPNPALRRHAIRLAESRFKSSPELLAAALKLADDKDAFVAMQLACSLGETNDISKIRALATLLKTHANDTYVSTSVMAAVTDAELQPLMGTLFAESADLPTALWSKLLELVGSSTNQDAVSAAIPFTGLFFVGAKPNEVKPDSVAPITALLAGLRRNPHRSKVLTDDAANELQSLVEHCMRVADDDQADMTARVKCIEVAGGAPQLRTSVLEGLRNYLNADQDSQLQLAAIEALAERNQPDFADALLSAWSTFTPAVRNKALDVLLTREAWVAALLAAIQKQTVHSSEIDAAHRSRLVEYPKAELRQQAAQCFTQSTSGERAAIVDRYEKSLATGDVGQGKAVFEKNCSVCHQFHGVGSQVGPDIAAREDKSKTGLLREILDPNRAVDQRFAEYVAVTADGRVKNGVLVEETSNAITLRGQKGEQTSLLRSELESLSSTGKSLMPEGFENQLTPQNMADLLQFLASP